MNLQLRTRRISLVVVPAAALLIAAAVAFGAVKLTRATAQPVQPTQPTVGSNGQGANGPPGPTVEHPLAATAEQVSIAQAMATFGPALVLPNTSAVQPSDLGPVWEIDARGGTWAAATFPSKRIFIQYGRPASANAPDIRAMASGLPGSDVVQLNEATPAVYATGNDGSGTNWMEFEADGADVRVLGPDDEATLEGIAQSILTQLPSPSTP